MSAIKLLSFLDLFGTTFKFTTFKEKKFHTWLGIILSMCTYVLVCVFIRIFGLDLFTQANPRIITEKVIPEGHEEYQFSTKNFTFAWRIEDSMSNPVNWTGKFYPYISYYYYKKEDNKSSSLALQFNKTWEPKICDVNHLSPDPSFSVGRNVSTWYCLDFTVKNLSVLGGFWDGDFARFFTITVDYCKFNNANVGPCTTKSELKKLLINENKLYFSVMYPSLYVDASYVESPLRYYYANYYSELSPNIQKTDRIFFKSTVADKDKNLFYNDYKKYEQLSFDSIAQDFNVKMDNDFEDKSLTTVLYQMDIYFSKPREKYTIRFMKLQDLAATVGGFIQCIIVIGSFICSVYNNYQRNIMLINELFDFSELNEDVESIVNSQLELKFYNSQHDNEIKQSDEKLKLAQNRKSMETNSENKEVRELLKSRTCKVIHYKETLPDETQANRNPRASQVQNKIESYKNLKQVKNVDKNAEAASSNSNTFKSMLNKEKVSERKTLNHLAKSSTIVEKKIKEDLTTYIHKKTKKNSITLIHLLRNLLEGVFCSQLHSKYNRHKKEEEISDLSVYKFASEYLLERLDLTSYIDLLDNMDKITLILFNESQKHSLKCMRRPNPFSAEELETFEIKPLNQDDEEMEYEREVKNCSLVKYYINKFQNKSFSDIDLILFDFLESNFKNAIISQISQGQTITLATNIK